MENKSMIKYKPVMTEKSTDLSDNLNTYCFLVSKDYNKNFLKKFFEDEFNVKIRCINTLITSGKSKRTAKGISSKKSFKKVFLKLEKDQKIELFSKEV